MFRFLRQTLRFIAFMFYYLKDFIVANIFLLVDMATPGSRATPGIVKFPLECKTDIEITLMSCLISLTPGTLTLAIQANPPVLFVHGIYAPEPDEFRERLKKLETHMLKGLRYPVVKNDSGGQK